MTPATLRIYAAVLRLPNRGSDGKMHMAGGVMMIAAEAMDFMAGAIERDDQNVLPGYRDVRHTTHLDGSITCDRCHFTVPSPSSIIIGSCTACSWQKTG